MLYPAKFIKEDNESYIVSFRDIPEALTQGSNLNEVKEMALNALIIAMGFYFEDNRPVPAPSSIEDDEILIELPISIWSKILLLNTMLEQHVTQSELAKRLGKTRQEMQRVINLEHNTKIDTIIEALKTLGKHPTFFI